MSPARSLTWLTTATCDKVATETGRMLLSWATHWSLPAPGPVQWTPVPAGTAEKDDYVDLLAEPSRAWKQSLAHAIFRFDVQGSRLADAVVQRVTAPLQRQLREAFASETLRAVEQGPLGDWGIEVRVEMLGQCCGFALTCTQLRATGWLAPVAPGALQAVNFEHALADTPVPMVAELGRADVSVDELMQLAPGDVLLLKQSLDEPLRVFAPGNSLALSAHLGAISSPPQRAVRWLAS